MRLQHCISDLQLGEDEDKPLTGTNMPSFDRGLKPLNNRRNINAARQRNFEPKYGNVVSICCLFT